VHGALLALERLLPRRRPPVLLSIGFTFLLVALAWVLFRAPTLDAALRFYAALAGGGDASTAAATIAWQWSAWAWIGAAALLAWLAPNTTQLFRRHSPGLVPAELQPLVEHGPVWRPTRIHALLLAALFVACSLVLSRETVFLYFQF
jgi:hypothetical protein